jgi:hypothetical protein
VYEMALSELARFLPKAHGHQNRFLRGNMRGNGRREFDGEDAQDEQASDTSPANANHHGA